MLKYSWKVVAVLLVLAVPGEAAAELRAWSGDVTPYVSRGMVVQSGEIVVMEGDDEIVTALGGGDLSISGPNLTAIVQRFYQWYPDEFDAITVFTAFPDPTNPGAYAICGERDVTGLGKPRNACPGASERLLSVTNMNDTDNYDTMGTNDLNWFAFMGQEFGHSWLTFWLFEDPVTKMESSELLGRDGSHYAPWVHAEGSYMDGVAFEDNGDGTFTVTEESVRYSSLDLYGMGIIPPSEVKPFFIVRDAQTLDGMPVAAAQRLGVGTVIRGKRVDLTIEDIMAASGGPRDPAWDDEPEEFRTAFVLVTAPGVRAQDPGVQARVAKLETGRLSWEDRFAADTQGRGFVCTDVTARCPRAAARIMSVAVKEKDATGDGVMEPGEQLVAVVELWNTGGADADSVRGELRSPAYGFEFEEPMSLPVVPVNEKRTVEIPFAINGEACGKELEVTAVATIEKRQWKASTTFRPGIREGEVQDFATPGGWEGASEEDTARTGRWQYGVPGPLHFAGRMLQPEGGRSGKTDPAWFTSIEGRWDTSELSGGATYLTSAPMDLSDVLSPMLVFHTWYLALDRQQNQLTTAKDAHLFVQVSSDGGESWRDIHAVSGGPFRWERIEVPVPDDVELTGDMRFRFMATDDASADARLVEIGIDDVQLNALVASCRLGGEDEGEGGGCGCRVGARPSMPAAGLFLFAVAALVTVRRRRG